jgi:hypothetical protein
MSECYALQIIIQNIIDGNSKCTNAHCIIVHVFERPCDLAGLNMLLDKERWAEVPTVRSSTTDVDPPHVSAGHFTSKKNRFIGASK